MPSAEHSHTPVAIAQRLSAGARPNYLRDFIYGAIDGAVTTFAVVSGVAGAGLSSQIVIVLGVANLIGDGFSMAASNFLGTRADQQLLDRARRMEERHIAQFPEGEREEIRQIFQRKGFSGERLEGAVEIITSDVDRWVDTMLIEELGMTLNVPAPFRAAMSTFAAFAVIGFLPLLPFVGQWLWPDFIQHPFRWSAIITGCAFFGVGAVKSRFVMQTWYRAGFETLGVGATAAALAFLAGFLLAGMAPG